MTFRIILEVNDEPVRTITAWNVGHPQTGETHPHDDLRRYNYSDGDKANGFVLHRRGLGAAELARKILEVVTGHELIR